MSKKYLSSVVFAFVLAVVMVFGVTEKASAQDGVSNAGGWCGIGSETECGFSSAGSACEYAVQSFYPNGSYVLEDVKEDTFTASCTLKLGNGGGLFVGTPRANHVCPESKGKSGSQCWTNQSQSRGRVCEAVSPMFTVGNPIDISTGRKLQKVLDFETADGRLKLQRHYMSSAFGASYVFWIGYRNLGIDWGLSTHPILQFDRDVTTGRVSPGGRLFMPEGTTYSYQYTSYNDSFELIYNADNRFSSGGPPAVQIELIGGLPSDAALGLAGLDQVIEVRDRTGVVYSFATDFVKPDEGPTYSGRSNSIERVFAKLVSARYEGGYEIQYTYNDLGELSSLVDSFGRTMTFNRDTLIRITPGGTERDYRTPITSVGLPDGTKMEYSYKTVRPNHQASNVPELLTRATRVAADGTVISNEQYLYEDSRFPSFMTGVIDSNNVRYRTWSYDENAMAISSEGPSGIENVTLERVAGAGDRDFVHATNALGKVTTYELEQGLARNVRAIRGNPSPNCLGDISTMSYSGSYVSRTRSGITITDKEGRISEKRFDDLGRQISFRRAIGTSEEVFETMEWHPIYRRMTRQTKPGLTIDYNVDDQGRVMSMTQTDTSSSPALPRQWSFTYDGPNVTSVDGPLAGAGDTQSYSYAGARLTSITNELGHVTQITAHNPIGAPTNIVDPNGNVTRLEYDKEHKLTGIIESFGTINAETRLTYNLVDLLTSVSQPNGSQLTFEYDDARRLMKISNSVGDSIYYTRNALGGILSTQISNQTGNIEFDISQVTDELNRVIKTATIGGSAGLLSETQLGYDLEDNLTSITDPR